MYGYKMVCISMYEYLLALSKVRTVPQPPAGARTRQAHRAEIQVITNNNKANYLKIKSKKKSQNGCRVLGNSSDFARD